MLKLNKIMPNITCSHKTLNLGNSSKNTKLKKNVLIPSGRRFFLVISLIFLYDEYIDRPKLSEQKKPIEDIVPPPPPQVGSDQLVPLELY